MMMDGDDAVLLVVVLVRTGLEITIEYSRTIGIENHLISSDSNLELS